MSFGTPSDTRHSVNRGPSTAASANFSILGTPIELAGGPEGDLAPVRRIYEAFETDGARRASRITWDGCVNPTRLVVDGNVYRGLSRKGISAVISMKIMESVYRRTEDFWLFHGAAAAWKGTLLLFPGETGSGKSSLAVGLAKRGWALFSDEVIAISRRRFVVSAFPRAITFHAGNAVVREIIPSRESSAYSLPLIMGGFKRILPFSLFGKPPQPLPPAAMICLEGSKRQRNRREREILVTLWNNSMELAARNKGLWQRMSVRKDGDFFRIKSDRATFIGDVCTSLGGIVLERDAAPHLRPTFGNSPVLRACSPDECLDPLWLVFENGRTLANGTSGITRLYAELARLANRMPCWMLRPGRVELTCELLRNLAERLRKNNGGSR